MYFCAIKVYLFFTARSIPKPIPIVKTIDVCEDNNSKQRQYLKGGICLKVKDKQVYAIFFTYLLLNSRELASL